MTAAPHSPLVEKVAVAIATRRAQANLPRALFVVDYAAPTADDILAAKAALDACHAEELARLLAQSATELDTAAELVGGQGLTGMASIFTHAANRNRTLLAKLGDRA